MRFLKLGGQVILVAMFVASGNAGVQTAPMLIGVRTFLSAPYKPDLLDTAFH
jgi:hypothetical protein